MERLTIIDIGAGGDGIAKMPDGQAIFVPLTVTGDVIDATVDDKGKGLLQAIVTPSPLRQEPPCRHFGRCGGCSLQHLQDDVYRGFKRDVVQDALAKAGVAASGIKEIFIPAGTRRRANFAARVVKGKSVIGFHERGSAVIRDVPDCLLITEDVRRVMTGFYNFLPRMISEGEKMDLLIQCIEGQAEAGLTGRLASGWEAQQALSDAMRELNLCRVSLRARDYEPYEIILKQSGFYKNFGSLRIDLAPGAFLQPSAEGERALVDCVIGGVGHASSIADLFCGNGTFTGPLLNGRRVMAADSAQDAIEALKRSGVDARVRNLFKAPLSADELQGYDCVIMDPPRAGAMEQTKILANSTVAKIVYVSCNPQSFARDAAILQAGGFECQDVTLVDQFIWSPHTELVSVFERA